MLSHGRSHSSPLACSAPSPAGTAKEVASVSGNLALASGLVGLAAPPSITGLLGLKGAPVASAVGKAMGWVSFGLGLVSVVAGCIGYSGDGVCWGQIPHTFVSMMFFAAPDSGISGNIFGVVVGSVWQFVDRDQTGRTG